MGQVYVVWEVQLWEFRGLLLFENCENICLKRGCATEHFISDDPYTPNIDFFVVAFAFELFGADIGKASNLSVSIGFCEDRAAEISNLSIGLNRISKYIIEEDVLGFDISVDDLFGVHVFEAKANLANVEGGLGLWNFPFSSSLHKGSIGH